jgi:hypothetical protein
MRIDYWLTDVHTGLLLSKIDLGNVSWTMTVNDTSLTTAPSKSVGKDEVQQIDVPWTSIPGTTQRERYSSVEPNCKGIAAFFLTNEDERDGSTGSPFFWGVITNKSDDWDSVTLSVSSIYGLMENRYVIREGDFQYPRSKNQVSFSGMTLRGLACEVLKIGMDKPGGALPLDLPYLGEKHNRIGNEDPTKHVRNYWAWNVSNISVQQVLDKLAGVSEGVDMQFRPYMYDAHHIRVKFVGGSDEERYLSQSGVPFVFSCYDGGGTLENVHVDYSQPVMRWYGTGAGQDAEVLTYMSEDLSLVNGGKPYSLVEKCFSDTDASNPDVLRGEVDGKLESWKWPLMQMSGQFNMASTTRAADGEEIHATPVLGSMWAGEICYLELSDYPDLPDGKYPLRIMEMSGDSSMKVKLTFDVTRVPYFN